MKRQLCMAVSALISFIVAMIFTARGDMGTATAMIFVTLILLPTEKK